MNARLKHRWSLGHNVLAGITAGDWWRLLRANRWEVDAVYWHRAIFISALSMVNSWHRWREDRRFGAVVAAVKTVEPPVFVLGHWRSGTTHLHNLLAADRDRFAYANTYQVANPHTFLTTEAVNTRLFSWLLPEQRPMDGMALGFGLPQEDEFAPLLMSGLSPYLGVSFPRREAFYDRYLTFAGVPEEEIRAWGRAMTTFVQKLTMHTGRRLVLKSPPHTARIRLLLDLFPGAQFIHIHRHPEDVFRSFRHYYDTAVWHAYLQRPDRTRVDGAIIGRYEAMYEAFLDQRGLIPEGDFCEVAFADLERDPLGVMEGIYGQLGWEGFGQSRGVIQHYLAGLQGYRRNDFPRLPEEVRERLRQSWGRYYQRWGYEIS